MAGTTVMRKSRRPNTRDSEKRGRANLSTLSGERRWLATGFACFGQFPEGLEFIGAQVLQTDLFVADLVFHVPEASGKSIVGLAQGRFRRTIEVPPQAGQRHQQITQLMFDLSRAPLGDGLAQFG